MFSTPPFQDPAFLQRILAQYAQGFATAAGAMGAWTAGGFPDAAGIEKSLAEAYERLISTAVPLPWAAPPAASGATGAGARYQAAAARWTVLLAGIAQDAGRRLSAALAEADPGAPPITSLAGLHALWIECGEAAYGEAARRDDFAEAQANLLLAAAELAAVAG